MDTEDEYVVMKVLNSYRIKIPLCANQDKAIIPKSWVLLDRLSTVDVFSYGKLLSNINDAKWVVTLYCNSGKAIVTMKGDLKVYGMLWYLLVGIANILSDLRQLYDHQVYSTQVRWY